MTEQAHDSAQLSFGLFVINLESASMAMPLRVPFRHELVGFSVFRSRKIEDGHERFRLHLGYFDTQAHAEEALAVVRKYYPSAWISSAPAENLGSLDDTFNTEFRLVRSAYARVVTAQELAKHEMAFTPPPPVPAKVVASTVVRQPVAAAESPSDTARKPARQRYAVQLLWSIMPIIAGDLPRLAIFDAYSLYTVREQREGQPQFGLRLGFFTNPDSARVVADYVRSEFSTASVIPVSFREYTRALEAAKQRALKAVESGELKRASATTTRIRE
jgi:hypothetical protein